MSEPSHAFQWKQHRLAINRTDTAASSILWKRRLCVLLKNYRTQRRTHPISSRCQSDAKSVRPKQIENSFTSTPTCHCHQGLVPNRSARGIVLHPPLLLSTQGVFTAPATRVQRYPKLSLFLSNRPTVNICPPCISYTRRALSKLQLCSPAAALISCRLASVLLDEVSLASPSPDVVPVFTQYGRRFFPYLPRVMPRSE